MNLSSYFLIRSHDQSSSVFRSDSIILSNLKTKVHLTIFSQEYHCYCPFVTCLLLKCYRQRCQHIITYKLQLTNRTLTGRFGFEPLLNIEWCRHSCLLRSISVKDLRIIIRHIHRILLLLLEIIQ